MNTSLICSSCAPAGLLVLLKIQAMKATVGAMLRLLPLLRLGTHLRHRCEAKYGA